MPKHWRKCEYCQVDTYHRPDLVVFSVRRSKRGIPQFICELHFQKEDIRVHGASKRLVSGAVPNIPDPPADQELNINEVDKLKIRS